MLTKKQLINFLNEGDEDEYGDSETNLYELGEGESLALEGFKIKLEDQFGGEGKGDDYWLVFSVSDGENKEFWQIPGWYSSACGSELDTDGMFRVEQVEKVVKVWQSIKK